MVANTPMVLIILDGWGYSENQQYNAIAEAKTPHWDRWWATQPHLLLDCSGSSVGLPDAQMGNSEVGHMHIGAGRRIPQDFTRINEAIASGEFFNTPLIIQTIQSLKASHHSLHLMGLLSPGGVHSHEHHLFALLKLCHQLDFRQVCLHLFLDGRDTPPKSAQQSLARLEAELKSYPVGKIVSIAGRYYAMDRDQRWERIQPVYQMMTEAVCESHFKTAEEAIDHFYQEGINDEFIPPSIIGQGQAIAEGDALFFFNFRADRARQLTQVFLQDSFTGFERCKRPRLSTFISMTGYDKNLPTQAAFPSMDLKNTLGEVFAKQGLSQLRIAETEKYAHVTFFFNGGSEQVFPAEERILIPSPKVATYDLQPEMSAPELTRTLIKAIEEARYQVIICNFANADMVGHTGNFAATVKAIETLDTCLGEIAAAVDSQGGCIFVTADHGNAEQMYNEHSHQIQTAHTTEPVPLLFIGQGWHFKAQKGSLVDIAPTLLAVLGIDTPKEMTGHNLMERNDG